MFEVAIFVFVSVNVFLKLVRQSQCEEHYFK